MEPSEFDGIVYDEFQLEKMLNLLSDTDSVKEGIRKFIHLTHKIDWGPSAGTILKENFSYPEMIQVSSEEEALKAHRSPENYRLIDENYAASTREIANFEDKRYIVSDLVREYCNMDFPHVLFRIIHVDLECAVLDILFEKYDSFLKKWDIYRSGHYLCGYLNEDTIVVW